jgi:hypothetical protein
LNWRVPTEALAEIVMAVLFDRSNVAVAVGTEGSPKVGIQLDRVFQSFESGAASQVAFGSVGSACAATAEADADQQSQTFSQNTPVPSAFRYLSNRRSSVHFVLRPSLLIWFQAANPLAARPQIGSEPPRNPSRESADCCSWNHLYLSSKRTVRPERARDAYTFDLCCGDV